MNVSIAIDPAELEKAILDDARAAAEHGRRAALWEAEMARRARSMSAA